MSFKIPNGLESLDFKPVNSVDSLQDGDLLVIPDIEEAPKLRVSLGTMRSWGLSVSESKYRTYYDCNSAYAVNTAFCGTGRSVYKFSSVSHNCNNASASQEHNIRIENANSVKNCTVVVEEPVRPLMSARIYPVMPLYPLLQVNAGEFPCTLSTECDKRAGKALLDAIGTKSLPGVSGSYVGEFNNLPFFMTFVSAICASSLSSNTLSERCIRELPLKTGSRRYNELSADRVLIAAAHDKKNDAKKHSTEISSVSSYMDYNRFDAEKLSVSMTRTFICNIVKRGALLYRAPAVHDLVGRIMAQKVSVEMHKRYNEIIRRMEEFISGLRHELPKVRRIAKRYGNASDILQCDNDIMSSIPKLFKNK